ncbi:putative lipin N terminal conserved region LNS2 (Lipin Ned1 Smp2) [Trypanosoma vivax]|nr:putative lipin N terminal conserved region LNS2 (Lipin Ned1 Smp2) [Trypanosoma vivax]
MFSSISGILDPNNLDLSSGANDVIVVRHLDGSLHSMPFNVRFGKVKVLIPADKVVRVEVNNCMTTAVMKIGPDGEAFWLKPTSSTHGNGGRPESPVVISDAVLSTQRTISEEAVKQALEAPLPIRDAVGGSVASCCSEGGGSGTPQEMVIPIEPRDPHVLEGCVVATSRELCYVESVSDSQMVGGTDVSGERVVLQSTASSSRSITQSQALVEATLAEMRSSPRSGYNTQVLVEDPKDEQQDLVVEQFPPSLSLLPNEISQEPSLTNCESGRSLPASDDGFRDLADEYAYEADIVPSNLCFSPSAVECKCTSYVADVGVAVVPEREAGSTADALISLGSPSPTDTRALAYSHVPGAPTVIHFVDEVRGVNQNIDSGCGSSVSGNKTIPCGISPVEKYGDEETVYFTRSLIPIEADLLKLNLLPGHNRVRYITHSSPRGEVAVEGNVYLWDSSDRLVVSDVDGTITKSDIWGHLMPLIGYDWIHPDVCPLYSKISRNGYRFVYLSARSVSQIRMTRDYLWSIQQNGFSLPKGPVLTAPQRFFAALTQEVKKKSHHFKIACLESVVKAFPPHSFPLYAGFGNRDSDFRSYIAARVPRNRIFIVDSKSKVKVDRIQLTYASIARIVDMVFPPIVKKEHSGPAPTATGSFLESSPHSDIAMISKPIPVPQLPFVSNECGESWYDASPPCKDGVAKVSTLSHHSTCNELSPAPNDTAPPPPDAVQGQMEMVKNIECAAVSESATVFDASEHVASEEFNSFLFWRLPPSSIVNTLPAPSPSEEKASVEKSEKQNSMQQSSWLSFRLKSANSRALE